MCVDCIDILGHRFELVSCDREVITPGILSRIEEAPTPGLDRCIRTRAIAESAGIETVRVISLLLGVLASRHAMLHGRAAQTLAASSAKEISFVEQAESADKPEIPP